MQNDTIEKITDFIFMGKKIEELDFYNLAIVLGNNLYEETAECLKDLVNLNKIDATSTIIISGKKGTLNKDLDGTEAEIIYQKFLKYNLNIPCLLEKEATNTKENLLFSLKYLEDIKSYRKILLICKSFLARRAFMCAYNLDYPIDSIDIIGVEKEFGKDNWFTNALSRKRVLAELERISLYTEKGDLKL